MNFKFKSLVIAALAFVSIATSARPVEDIIYYAPQYTGGSYSAIVNYNGRASTIATADIANTGAGLTQFISGLSNSYWSIRSGLISTLTPVIASQGATLNGVGQWGDIRIGVAGVAGGNLKLDTSGLNLDMDVTAKKSILFGTVTCQSRITLSNIAFSSQYNPFTGAVSGTNVTYTPSQSTSCDSSFSWIPFIGDFINQKAGNLAGAKILESVSGYSGKIIDISPQKAFFSFTNAITPGAFMVGTTDAGMFLKNNLQNLYVGKRVDVFIANDYKYEPPSRLSAPGAGSYSGNRFSITFSDASTNVGFSVAATKNYIWNERLLPGTGSSGG